MSKVSYCSLDEAWGDSYEKKNDEGPIGDNTVSYSGGSQHSNDLISHHSKDKNVIQDNNNTQPPQFTENKYKNDLFQGESFLKDDSQFAHVPQQHATEQHNQFQQNTSTDIVPHNRGGSLATMDREKLFDEFMKFIEYKKTGSIYNNDIESFTNLKALGNNDNSYVDLVILILFGIIMIFIMDSFVRLGRNSKSQSGGQEY